MRCVVGLTLLLFAAATARGDDPKPPPTPADEYKALVAAQQKASADFNAAYQAAKTEAERKQVVEDLGRKSSADRFADDFLALVEKYPNDPAALTAFLWLNMRLPDREQTTAAAEIVGREWVADERFASVCKSLWYRAGSPAEKLLRAAVMKSPHRDVQGYARFSLAQAKLARMNRIQDAESKERLALEGEVEKLLTEVMADYADLKHFTTLGQEADAMLFEVLHLSVGKVAQDITGDDMAGKPLKLSEARGKVTLLAFGASWCGPCMADAPKELALLKKYGEKGFAVVGVNCDGDLETGKAAYEKAGITWRSFADGRDGPIARRWNVTAWPTLYLLDAKGVIRYKGDTLRAIVTREDAGGNIVQTTSLEEAVEALVKEATGAK